METGRIVFSKAGRDKRRAFVVASSDGGYVYLVDGDIRPLSRPKKKKLMHVQPTNSFAEEVGHKLENNLYINDAEIRKALSLFSSHREA